MRYITKERGLQMDLNDIRDKKAKKDKGVQIWLSKKKKDAFAKKAKKQGYSMQAVLEAFVESYIKGDI